MEAGRLGSREAGGAGTPAIWFIKFIELKAGAFAQVYRSVAYTLNIWKVLYLQKFCIKPFVTYFT
jgi:hypothetical protein